MSKTVGCVRVDLTQGDVFFYDVSLKMARLFLFNFKGRLMTELPRKRGRTAIGI